MRISYHTIDTFVPGEHGHHPAETSGQARVVADAFSDMMLEF